MNDQHAVVVPPARPPVHALHLRDSQRPRELQFKHRRVPAKLELKQKQFVAARPTAPAALRPISFVWAITTAETTMNLQKGIQRPGASPARVRVEPPPEGAMWNNMNGWMGGSGLSTIIAVLLIVFLIVSIVRMLQKR